LDQGATNDWRDDDDRDAIQDRLSDEVAELAGNGTQ
jgi:hypothetical protein